MADSPFDALDPIQGTFHIVDSDAAAGGPGTISFEPHGVFAVSHATVDRRDVYGLAAIFRGRLLIATGPKDKVEIGAYHLSGNRLEGIWVPPGARGCDLAICGREVSRRTREDTFEIEAAHAVDQMPYTGRLALTYDDPEAAGVRRVKFHWSLHDGEYESFGLASAEILVSTFNFESGSAFSIGLYEPHGREWRGTIARSDSPGVTHETLRR